MILHVHSDTSYLSEPKAKIRAGCHLFFSNKTSTSNGPIFNECSIMKNVLSSTSEAELGALYINAKSTLFIRHILEALNHPQPPTPIATDNLTHMVSSIKVLNKIKQKI